VRKHFFLRSDENVLEVKEFGRNLEEEVQGGRLYGTQKEGKEEKDFLKREVIKWP
jgi:hypothetical protein